MDQAILDFNKGIELDPEFRQGYLMRSLYYQSTNQFDAAAKDLKKAIQLRPTDSKAMYEAGLCLNRANKPQESLRVFEQSRSIEFENRALLFGAGEEVILRLEIQRQQRKTIKLPKIGRPVDYLEQRPLR